MRTIRHSYVKDPLGPINKLIENLVAHKKHMGSHLMGHILYAQLELKPQNHILSPINKAIEYICVRTFQTDDQVSQLSLQICQTIANRLYWRDANSLEFLFEPRDLNAISVSRYKIKYLMASPERSPTPSARRNGCARPLYEQRSSRTFPIMVCPKPTYLPLASDIEDVYYALSVAIVADQIEIFKYLLSSHKKIKINVNNNYFGCLLHLSALWNRIEFIDVLLARGANPAIVQWEYRRTPKCAPVGIGSDLTTKYCQTMFFSNIPFQGSALQIAARAGHTGVVKKLLKRVDVEWISDFEYGDTILAAIKGGHPSLAISLLEASPQRMVPHIKSLGFRQRMYKQACYSGCQKIVASMLKLMASMLERGDDLTSVERYRPTYPTRELCIDKDEWFSAIELATIHGHHNVVQLLLENGADRDTLRHRQIKSETTSTKGIRNGIPISPLQIASANGHEKVVQTLLNSGIKLDSLDVYFAFVQAARMDQDRIMKLFLKNGLDINMVPTNVPVEASWGLSLGEQSFIVAYMHHRTSSIEILVAEGVRIYIPEFSRPVNRHNSTCIEMWQNAMMDVFLQGSSPGSLTKDRCQDIFKKSGARKKHISKDFAESFMWETDYLSDPHWPACPLQALTLSEYK